MNHTAVYVAFSRRESDDDDDQLDHHHHHHRPKLCEMSRPSIVIETVSITSNDDNDDISRTSDGARIDFGDNDAAGYDYSSSSEEDDPNFLSVPKEGSTCSSSSEDESYFRDLVHRYAPPLPAAKPTHANGPLSSVIKAEVAPSLPSAAGKPMDRVPLFRSRSILDDINEEEFDEEEEEEQQEEVASINE